MSQMAGKIIGTELFSRVRSVGEQILRPRLKKPLIRLCKLRIFVYFTAGGRHDQHISAFLYGHLKLQIVDITRRILVIGRKYGSVGLKVLLSLFLRIQPVDLSPRIRIAAHIMRRKVILPHVTGGKAEHRPQHPFYVIRAVHEEQRH